MGKIKRGVSLYSYQQSQFFKELDLEGQIREVGTNLFGADGIENPGGCYFSDEIFSAAGLRRVFY